MLDGLYKGTSPCLLADNGNELYPRSPRAIIFEQGVNVTANKYWIGKDNNNQLHFNVPNGAGYEFSVNNATRIKINSSGCILAQDGTYSAPTYSFASNPNTGIYLNSTNNIAISAGGSIRMIVAPSVTYIYNPVYSATGSSFSIFGRQSNSSTAVNIILDCTTALTQPGAKLTSFRNAGTEKAFVDNNGLFGWISANTQTTVGSAGSAQALPSNPAGYAKINVNGTEYVIPYYNVS